MTKIIFILLTILTANTFGYLFGQNNDLFKLSKRASVSISGGSQNSTDGNFEYKRLTAIYGSSDEYDIANTLLQQTHLEELHLKIRCDSDSYSFGFVSRLPDLKVLTISFYTPGENTCTSCGNTLKPLDLSFLQQLTNLRILVIEWDGILLNSKVIHSLNNLVYVSFSSQNFDPSLFTNHSSIRQLDFGNERHLKFSRSQKTETLLELDHNVSYSEQLSYANANYKSFLRFLKKNTKQALPDWPAFELIRDTNEDTLLYVSKKSDGIAQWKLQSNQASVKISGYNNVTNTTSFKQVDFPHYTIKLTQNKPGETNITYMRYDDLGQLIETVQSGYKGVLPHGLFLKRTADGTIVYQKHYVNGLLKSTYPYSGPVPELPDLLGVNYNHFRFSMEAYFDEDESPSFIYFYSFKRDTLHNVLSIPFLNNRVHGTIMIKDAEGNSVLSADYKEGLLHGSYYYLDATPPDSIYYIRNYRNGKQEGEQKRLQKETVSTFYIKNDQLVKSNTVSTSTGKTLASYKWNQEKQCFESYYWYPSGKLKSAYLLDSAGKYNGLQLEYFENGQVRTKNDYIHGLRNTE